VAKERVAADARADVTKEYFEDLHGEQDEHGRYAAEYRYWEYTFDFIERAYRGSHIQGRAGTRQRVSPRHDRLSTRRSVRDRYLRAVRSHLEAEKWGRVDMRVLARGRDGYVSVTLD
jgi:hypothetical protein